MGEVAEREKHALETAAEIRRWAHSVEEQRERRPTGQWVVAVGSRILANVRNAAAIQFREQRPEPVGMLVINGEGLHGVLRGTVILSLPRTNRTLTLDTLSPCGRGWFVRAANKPGEGSAGATTPHPVCSLRSQTTLSRKGRGFPMALPENCFLIIHGFSNKCGARAFAANRPG